MIEVIVPVRPGDKDRFPVKGSGVVTREIECADGNLSQVYRDAYLESDAEIVIFKHDDLWIRNWNNYIYQVEHQLKYHYVVGVAGTRSYAPNRNIAWWMQSAVRVGHVDGLNRGLVSHPSNQVINSKYIPTLFGEPGPAVVMDGCLLAVSHPFNYYDVDQIGKCFDLEFTYHFYDVAFTMNVSESLKHGYVICSDIVHEGVGELTPAWHEAGKRFVDKYSRGVPLVV